MSKYTQNLNINKVELIKPINMANSLNLPDGNKKPLNNLEGRLILL